jgi:hypothetical protein
LNPSGFPPINVFWTIEIPEKGVDVDFGKGSAVMSAQNVPILDYGDIGNALFGGGPAAVPGVVSFTCRWGGVEQRVKIRNDDPVYGGFAGDFIYNRAQLQWSGTVGDLSFVSDPISASSSSFALLGHERNGRFFP